MRSLRSPGATGLTSHLSPLIPFPKCAASRFQTRLDQTIALRSPSSFTRKLSESHRQGQVNRRELTTGTTNE